MKILLWTASLLIVVVLLAAAAQTFRYLRTRRDVVADRQELFYSSSVFHVVTLVELAPGQGLLPGVSRLVEAIEEQGAKAIYAGKVAVNALYSKQLPEVEWDAYVLAQYPSRAAYDASAADPAYQEARESFARSYAMGMQRPAVLNLGVPIGLLGVRAADIVRGRPPRYPFEPAVLPEDVPEEMLARRDQLVRGLLANREYGSEALVVFNFIKEGSEEERAANAGYGRTMLGMMAELGIGPMHIGRAVTLEGDAEFDNIAIVYYPGVEFFAEMVQSSFYTSISGGKQLGDTLVSPTVPLLPHL
ncbi:MAG: hypothetical protein CL910_11250 [Deltaproteobacteria bacterium]|jgi:hypothetical protein|nr:hypothetical protein [Deltaproteobacteria bacterium]